MNRRTFLKALPASVGLAASWRIGYAGGSAPQQFTIPTGVDTLAPKLPIPTLLKIAPTGDIDDVRDYWHNYETELKGMFADEDRAAALFAMYLVAIAVPYGVQPMCINGDVPYCTHATLAEYVHLQRAHCGIYARVQAEVSRALGLTARVVEFTDGWHGVCEVMIGKHYEVFDSTVNVWLNQPLEALVAGTTRLTFPYYTPILDMSAPDVFRAHIAEGYDVLTLRRREPWFGLELGTHFAPIEVAT